MITPTPQQQRVLDAGPTSLRISAGAGTGKTTTVALAVANLVNNHDVPPDRVLGLTFTNKAAAELSGRIGSLLDGNAHPEVATYHGFASSILTEFGALVGVERGATLLNAANRRQLIDGIVANTDALHINMTWAGIVDPILRLGDQISQSLITPEDVPIPDNPDEIWSERAEMLGILADYETEKRRLGVLDYGDLMSRAHRLVSTHPEIRKTIGQRYLVVVLDEYQDTDPTQRELLRILFGDGTPVIAVGDTAQTIYEWRGASIENFIHFPDHFLTPTGDTPDTVELNRNRRSRPEILAVANRIRAGHIDAAAPLAAILAVGDDHRSGVVATRMLGDAVAEAEWITRRVVALHDEGVAWRDMAILFRKNKNMDVIRDTLATHDVPMEVANLGGLLGIPEVADLHAWLRILADPEDGAAFIRIITGSRFRLGLGDLAPLAGWVRRAERGRGADPDPDLDDEAPAHSLIEAMDHLDTFDLQPEAAIRLSRFQDLYRRFVAVAQSERLVGLCRFIIDTIGVWDDIETLTDAGRLSGRLNLYRFLDLAESWSPLDGRPTLSAFVRYLSALEETPSEELDTARLSGEDAVTLVTVHRAKGLEWDTVFIPAAVHNTFPASASAYDDPETKPYFLPHEYRLGGRDGSTQVEPSERDRKQALRDHHYAQEWRIAYVAVTRAKQHLFVTAAHWYGSPEPLKNAVRPSELYDIVEELSTVPPERDPAPPRPELLWRTTDEGPGPDPLFPEGWAAALRNTANDPNHVATIATLHSISAAHTATTAQYRERLVNLPPDRKTPERGNALEATSVTGMVTYAGCPKRFYWSEVDRLPRRPSPAARRGTDVHRRIELHSLGHDTLFDLGEVASTIPDATRDRGADPYTTYLQSPYSDLESVAIESQFEFDVTKDFRLRGRIDAIYRWPDGHFEIVDFKSGRLRDNPAAVVQLQAYAAAAPGLRIGITETDRFRVSFVHLGDGLEVRSWDADRSWRSQAESHLTDLADGITAGRFEPRPSPDCERCDFLRFCEEGRAFLEGDRDS